MQTKGGVSAHAAEISPVRAVCAKVISPEGQIVSCGLTDHQPGSPLPELTETVSGNAGDRELTPLLAGSLDPGYFARAIVQQTVCGTDQWCYMVRRQDTGSRIRQARIVVCPDVVVKKNT